MAELASAYVTIIPSLKGAAGNISNALSGVDTKSAGSKMGGGLLGGITDVFGGGKRLVGAIVGSALIGGGISRAMKLEEAEYKFKAMGINVEKAMASCNEAVKGTAYGLDAAATIASMLGASGIKAGDEMTRSLKAATGMAAMGGVQLERVGAVFSKVAATGRLQGDELMQFTEMGINATASLAKHLGKSQAEVSEMISKGEIDFKTFSDAMYATFGDAAQGANNTFSGAMSNMRSAISRCVAKFATPVLQGLRKVFAGLIPVIDAVSATLDPVVDVFSKFVDLVSSKTATALEVFGTKLAETGNYFEAFKAVFSAASGNVGGVIDTIKAKVETLPAPVQNIIGQFTAFGQRIVDSLSNIHVGGGAALGGFIAMFATLMIKCKGPIDTVLAAIVGFGSKLGAVFATVASHGGVFALLATKLRTFGAAVTLCGGGLKGLVAVLGLSVSPITIVAAVVAALVAAFVYLMATSEEFRSTIGTLVATIGASLAPAVASIGAAFASLAASVLPVVTNLVASLMPVLGQVITIIFQVIAALAPVISMLIGTLAPILSSIISLVVNVAAQIITAVLPVIQIILTGIQTVLPVIQAIFIAAMTAILNVVQAVWPFIQTVITATMNVIQAIISVVTSAISGDWGAAWDAIGSVFSAMWDGAISVLSAALGTLQSLVSSGIANVKGIISALPGEIQGMFAGAASWLVNAGSSICDGLAQGIRNGISKAKSALQDGLSALRNLLPFSPAKEGPFSGHGWTLYSGMSIMEALGQGITRNGGSAVSAMSGVLSDVSAAATAEMEPFGSVSKASGYGVSSGSAAIGGDVYNVYFNDNKVNDDEEILAVFTNMLQVMKRKGAM